MTPNPTGKELYTFCNTGSARSSFLMHCKRTGWKSNRVVTIPALLVKALRDYMEQWYGLEQNDRIFPYTKNIVNHVMARACEAVGVKKIRVHDIRHSHASMLVELGFSPLLIAERLGHERVQTTMETYSHLYPNKQAEVAMQLDGLATND